jgi:E3 ubiquitin-protein ligase HERC4
MYGWGSTIHGELALGGIEAENIFMPREVEFIEAGNIEQSMLFKISRIVVTYGISIVRRIDQKLKL